MDQQQIRSLVLEALKGIAPELEADQLRGDRPLRAEVNLDSMDWLRFISALHQRLGVNIPPASGQPERPGRLPGATARALNRPLARRLPRNSRFLGAMQVVCEGCAMRTTCNAHLVRTVFGFGVEQYRKVHRAFAITDHRTVLSLRL